MSQFVRKWGNSAAVRIPASILDAAGLQPDDQVDVREENGRIVIERMSKPRRDLETLIERITPENRHGETDWNSRVGREFW